MVVQNSPSHLDLSETSLQDVAPSGFWKLPFRGILRSQDPVSSKLSLCLAHIFIMCLCSSRIKCNTIIKHPADCGGTQGWTKRPRAGNRQLGPQSRECDMCYQLMKEWGVPLRERDGGGQGSKVSLSCQRNLMQMVLPVPRFLSPGISEYQEDEGHAENRMEI